MFARGLVSWLFLAALTSASWAEFTDLRTIFVDRFDYTYNSGNIPAMVSAINTQMQNAANQGFTDVVWQVRGRGDALYNSNFEPKATGLTAGFDPLQTALDAAHSRGLKLHAWINSTNLWQGTTTPPASHMFYNTSPSFRLVDINGTVEPQQGYSGGGYSSVNLILPEVHQHINNVVNDIATNYAVDGINLDYIRYIPGNSFSRLPHDALSHSIFFDATGLNGASSANATAYRNFMKLRITDLVASIKDTVDAAEVMTGREILLSADVWRDPDVGENDYYQDYRTWLELDLLDIAIPMLYLSASNDGTFFNANLMNTLSIPTNTRIAPVLASYLHTDPGGGGVSLTLSQIQRAHDFGADGIGFYDYPAFFNSYSAADRQAIADLFVALEPGDPQPTVLADFDVDEVPFGWAPTFSGSNVNISNGSTADRVTDEAFEGAGAQRIVVAPSGPGSWLLRHVSGNGTSGTVASPAGNVPFDAQGFVGFWLKTTDPGVSVQIALDDPGTADRGLSKAVIADGLWHLYEWDLDDDAQWEAWVTGDGVITGPTVTLDSIQFAGTEGATIYMDLVWHNPTASLLPELIPGDYNRDGAVGPEDYAEWANAFGQAVAPGSGADGNGDGNIDAADYTMWRDHRGQFVTPQGAGSLSAAATTPEPTSGVLVVVAGLAWLARRHARRRIS